MKNSTRNQWAAIAIVSSILALGSWAVSSPVGSGPDDDFHNASIWCGQGIREDFCEEGSSPDSVLVPETVIVNSFCFAQQPDNSGACPQSTEMVETSRTNFTSNVYPTIYYWTMSLFTTPDIPGSILSMRIFNSVLVVLLFAITLIALPNHLRRTPLFGFIFSSVPLGLFLVSSVNPSGWSYASVLLFFAAALGFLSAKENKQRAMFGALSVVSLLMGVGSREDTPAYLLLAGILAWILTFSSKNFNRLIPIFGVGLAVLISVFVFLTFTSQSFIGYIIRGFDWYGGVTTLGALIQNFLRLPDLWVGAFGTWGLGWLDTPLPSSVWTVTLGIFVSLVFGSIHYFGRLQKLAFFFVALALVVVPMYTLSVNGLLVGQIIQPRYLLPLLGLLMAVALYRDSSIGGIKLSRSQLLIIGLGLSVANAISLHTNLRRYLTGLDENQVSLNYEIEWWWVERPTADSILWFSPNYVWLAGSLCFALLLFSLWKMRFELGISAEHLESPLDVRSTDPWLDQTKASDQRSWFRRIFKARKKDLAKTAKP